MSGVQVSQVGWLQIPGPQLAIDTSTFSLGGPYNANVRSDTDAISIWQRTPAFGSRQWQYWTPADGWSGLADFPTDYSGGVGWLQFNQGNPAPWFAATELTQTTEGEQAIRVHRVNFDGSSYANNYWPRQALWSVTSPDAVQMAMNAAFGGILSPLNFLPDALDNTQLANWITERDPNHIFIFVGANSMVGVPSIGSVALGFNPSSGAPDYGIFMDLLAGNFTQNFGRAQFLYTGSGVNTMVCSPTAQSPFGELTYSAPFNEFPDNYLPFFDFVPEGFGAIGPIFAATTDFNGGIAPAAEVRVRPVNNQQSIVFPNTGIPGYAMEVGTLTPLQAQMRAACFSGEFYGSLPAGVQDQFVTVSAWNITDPTDPNFPNIQGIIYIPYWQQFQGIPLGVQWPVAAVPPFYGLLMNGGVYLLDSAFPTQMFQLTYLTTTFAGLYPVANWVRMGNT